MIVVSKLAALDTLANLRRNSAFIRTKLREGRVVLKKKANSTDPPPASPTNLKSPASQTEATTPPNPASDFSPAASGPTTPVVGEEPLELKKYIAKLREKRARPRDEDLAKVTATATRTGAAQLVKLLSFIKKMGNGGHSFDIVLDPKSFEKYRKDDHYLETNIVGWDGDGSDDLFDITAETTPPLNADDEE